MVNADPDRLGGIHIEVGMFWVPEETEDVALSVNASTLSRPPSPSSQSQRRKFGSSRRRSVSTDSDDSDGPRPGGFRGGKASAKAAAASGKSSARGKGGKSTPSMSSPVLPSGGMPGRRNTGDLDLDLEASALPFGSPASAPEVVVESRYRLGIHVTLLSSYSGTAALTPDAALRRESFDEAGSRKRRRGSIPLNFRAGTGAGAGAGTGAGVGTSISEGWLH
jgi:hypothetical protein